MGNMPYPCGIFLCRKNLQDTVSLNVFYLGGHQDNTIIGSRTAISAFCLHYYFKEG